MIIIHLLLMSIILLCGECKGPKQPSPSQGQSSTPRPISNDTKSDGNDTEVTTAATMSTTENPKSKAAKNKRDRYIEEHERLLRDVFGEPSNSAVRPLFGGEPINVTCAIEVVAIDTLSERTMDYSISLSLYLEWNDPRLTHNSSGEIVFQTVDIIEKAWLPDVYFVNEKNGMFHNIISENIALYVHKNGDVIYSMRLGLTLTCYMQLNYFPMDRQECPITMRSYAYNNRNIQLKWKHSGGDHDGMEYNEHIKMPQFNVINITTSSEESQLRLGNFSTLMARFTLERVMGFYIVHTFLPSFLLVMLSWITFWLHVDATPARASLGITTVLTVTTQVSASRFTLPEVSYPTALDIWFSGCLMFVFSALLEFALVNYIYLLDIRVRPSKQTGTKSVYATTEPSSMDVSNNSFVPGEYKPKTDIFAVKYDSSSAATKNGIANNAGETFKPYVQYAQRIDRISRVVFPLLFTFFNVLFWSIYLHEPTN